MSLAQLLTEVPEAADAPSAWRGRISLVALAEPLLARITRMRQIRLSAPVPCPSCRRPVTGRWTAGQRTAAHQCGSCGHVFTATWPGWPVEPETVTVT